MFQLVAVLGIRENYCLRTPQPEAHGESEMPRKLKITVDTNVCVGNAMCEHFAANTFALNEDRQSMVANADGDPEEKVLEAAENCPVSAITVADAETGETLFP